jgi:uncharacterized protein
MRLSSQQKKVITDCVGTVDASAEVFLYGSRVDDTKKGGDIDLLIVSETLTFAHKLQISAQIKKLLGDQKIDILIHSQASAEKDPFVAVIRPTAIKL